MAYGDRTDKLAMPRRTEPENVDGITSAWIKEKKN